MRPDRHSGRQVCYHEVEEDYFFKRDVISKLICSNDLLLWRMLEYLNGLNCRLIKENKWCMVYN